MQNTTFEQIKLSFDRIFCRAIRTSMSLLNNEEMPSEISGIKGSINT